MDNLERSSQFDVLYNNVTSNQAPGLNEYEKSVLFTKAQSMLLSEYFNNRVDAAWGGFDGSQRRQYDFSSIIKVCNLPYMSNVPDAVKIDRRSVVYTFPKDYFLSVNEILSDDSYQYSVLPVSYSEYQRLMLKPYNFPVKRGAWRLMNGKGDYNEYSDANGYSFACPVYTKEPLTITMFKYVNSLLTPDSDWYNGGVISMISTKGSTPNNIISLTMNYQEFTNGIKLYFTVKVEEDDAHIITMAKELFDAVHAKYVNHQLPENNRFVLVGKVLGWFASMQAPIGGNEFGKPEGKEMTAEIKANAISAEIIGKFNSTPIYQLRYVKKPRPIILENLSNYGQGLTIDGESGPCECELPEETHQEILERAVTLAKIAWQGGTVTQAQAAAQQQK